MSKPPGADAHRLREASCEPAAAPTAVGTGLRACARAPTGRGSADPDALDDVEDRARLLHARFDLGRLLAQLLLVDVLAEDLLDVREDVEGRDLVAAPAQHTQGVEARGGPTPLVEAEDLQLQGRGVAHLAHPADEVVEPARTAR